MNKVVAGYVFLTATMLANFSCKRDEPEQKPVPVFQQESNLQESVGGEFPKSPQQGRNLVDCVLYLKVVPVKKAKSSYVTKYLVKNKPENIKALDELVKAERALRKRFNYLEEKGLDPSSDEEYRGLEKRVAEMQLTLPEFEDLISSDYYNGLEHKSGVVASEDFSKYYKR